MSDRTAFDAITKDKHTPTAICGFAPNSEAAQVLSNPLGTRTVMSGSVSQNRKKTTKTKRVPNFRKGRSALNYWFAVNKEKADISQINDLECIEMGTAIDKIVLL